MIDYYPQKNKIKIKIKRAYQNRQPPKLPWVNKSQQRRKAIRIDDTTHGTTG